MCLIARSILLLAVMFSSGALLQLLVSEACITRRKHSQAMIRTAANVDGGVRFAQACCWRCGAMLIANAMSAAFCLQGCVLWRNWWPMLTGILYILVPMPYIFFGSSPAGEYFCGCDCRGHRIA